MRYVQIHGPPDEQVVTIWTLHDRVHARWRREYEVPFVETWDGKRYKRSEMERKGQLMLGGAEGGSGVRALRDDPLTKTPSVGTLPFFVRVWEKNAKLPNGRVLCKTSA
ncbi:hypothetical protein [Oryza sativa Japonica Group]|uniref:Uncharacterized protein n=1 Tax=Oryza sativa subsp. japonica TaxID=39947 RepID=Q5NA89_ORYSJ|nr:hypothetical protein [Oryza sativa Japonica Group]BAE95814.1 hypothetical protein [Oryza sativa Japonica Group]